MENQKQKMIILIGLSGDLDFFYENNIKDIAKICKQVLAGVSANKICVMSTKGEKAVAYAEIIKQVLRLENEVKVFTGQQNDVSELMVLDEWKKIFQDQLEISELVIIVQHDKSVHKENGIKVIVSHYSDMDAEFCEPYRYIYNLV